MNILLLMMILVPATGLLVSLLLPGKSEVLISRTVFMTVGLSFLVSLSLFVTWLCLSTPVIDFKELVLYKNSNYEYFIDFHFDEISAVYALVGSLLTFLIAVYSRVYLHRENGYKRFFNTILFCYLGYNLIIFSGNLETLFIGWEFLGIASFLLIAFYRDRYLPVRNAVKVYSVYRLGDVGLLLAMWLIHHLFHGNIIFNTLDNPAIVHAHLAGNEWAGPAIAGLLLLVALVKSAQFPFTSWLPRAMEGPTPSSAIFYGSLSVHLGVFILLRTFHFWEDQISVRILIGSFGLLTAIASTGIARVQSSVKTQIAYSSAAQIGLIFIEVALGLKWVALMHFAGNAFFGTYKLLVSPSVVSYLIREQFYNFKPRQRTLEDSLPKRLSYGFYMLCLKEWHLDTMVHRLYRMPIKRLGNLLKFMNGWQMLGVFGFLFVGGIVLRLFESSIPADLRHFLPNVFAFLGLLMVVRAYVERKSAKTAWSLVTAMHFWLALAVSFNEHFAIVQFVLYLSGVTVAMVVGFVCIFYLESKEGAINVDHYQGHAFEHPTLYLVFFLACMGITGFPITPTFIGEDLILSHIHENQIPLVTIAALSLVIDGLAVIRIFAKVFNGPHLKNYHEIAYKSS